MSLEHLEIVTSLATIVSVCHKVPCKALKRLICFSVEFLLKRGNWSMVPISEGIARLRGKFVTRRHWWL